MAYYLKVLRPEETVHFLGRLHWVIYGRAIVILGLAALSSAAWPFMRLNPAWGAALAMLAVVLLVAGLLDASGAAVRRKTTEIVVTDLRVIIKTGLFARRSVEMNIGKIETVDVIQSVTARLLGYGTVLVRGIGSGLEPLVRVDNPIALRNAILVG